MYYKNTTGGCPIAGECDFGYKGVAFVGEGTDLLVGGYGTAGSFNVTAPMDKPCYISLINMRLNRLDVSVQGVNVQA